MPYAFLSHTDLFGIHLPWSPMTTRLSFPSFTTRVAALRSVLNLLHIHLFIDSENNHNWAMPKDTGVP